MPLGQERQISQRKVMIMGIEQDIGSMHNDMSIGLRDIEGKIRELNSSITTQTIEFYKIGYDIKEIKFILWSCLVIQILFFLTMCQHFVWKL